MKYIETERLILRSWKEEDKANFARMNDIDAETALRGANDKFERRFKGMERDFKQKNEPMEKASLEAMELSWVEQKRKERA